MMIKKTDLTKERIKFNRERFVHNMFGLAPLVDIWFDDTEIKYIETKMMSHKLYRLVNGNAAGITWHDRKLFDFQRSWLTSFLDDSDIPIGVRGFIIYYIGHEQACMKIYDKFTGKQRYSDSITHKFLAEKWIEKCH